MRKYTIRFNLRKLSKIAKSAWIVWVLLGVITCACFAGAAGSGYALLEDTQQLSVTPENVYIIDTHDLKGDRFVLFLEADGNKYYFYYPSGTYLQHRDLVRSELLTGKAASVEMIVSRNFSLADYLRNRTRIVDLRSGESVYYDIETERAAIKKEQISLLILTPFFIVIWVAFSVFELIIYDVLHIAKRKK